MGSMNVLSGVFGEGQLAIGSRTSTVGDVVVKELSCQEGIEHAVGLRGGMPRNGIGHVTGVGLLSRPVNDVEEPDFGRHPSVVTLSLQLVILALYWLTLASARERRWLDWRTGPLGKCPPSE